MGGGDGIIRAPPRGESNFEQRNFCRPYGFFVVFTLFTHSTISHKVHNFDRGKRETRYIVELLSLGFGDSHSSCEYTGVRTWSDIQMNKRVINALLLSATLGWVVPVMAQDSSLESIFAVGESTKIYPASIPRNMLWSVITLIAPDDEYRPIPLYTYKGLDDEKIKKILTEAANGNVHIAAVRNSKGDRNSTDDSFLAYGIQISDNDGLDNVEWRDIKRKIREINEIGDGEELALAFTRLIDPQIIADSEIERSEYFTSPKLWQNLDKNPLKQ